MTPIEVTLAMAILRPQEANSQGHVLHMCSNSSRNNQLQQELHLTAIVKHQFHRQSVLQFLQLLPALSNIHLRQQL